MTNENAAAAGKSVRIAGMAGFDPGRITALASMNLPKVYPDTYSTISAAYKPFAVSMPSFKFATDNMFKDLIFPKMDFAKIISPPVFDYANIMKPFLDEITRSNAQTMSMFTSSITSSVALPESLFSIQKSVMAMLGETINFKPIIESIMAPIKVQMHDNFATLVTDWAKLAESAPDIDTINELADGLLAEQPDLERQLEESEGYHALTPSQKKLAIWFVRITVFLCVTYGILDYSVDHPDFKSLLEVFQITPYAAVFRRGFR